MDDDKKHPYIPRQRPLSGTQKKALETLKAARWKAAVTMNAEDSAHFADLPHDKFQEQMMEKALPGVQTDDPAITPEVLRAAGIRFNMPGGPDDKEGIVLNPDTQEWMVYGHMNLGLMAYHGVDIPEGKLFAEKYAHYMNEHRRRTEMN